MHEKGYHIDTLVCGHEGVVRWDHNQLYGRLVVTGGDVMVITAKVVFFMERAQDWFKVSCNSSQSFYVRLAADYKVLENLYRYHLALYEQSIQAGGSLVDLSRDVDKAGGAILAPDKSLTDRLDRYKDFEVQLTENISEIFNYVHAETNRWLSAEYSRYSYVAYQKLHDILPQSTLCSETQEDIVRAFAHLLS